jgi:uncharacterized membrane protein
MRSTDSKRGAPACPATSDLGDQRRHERLNSIDAMRGIAIASMVVCHSIIYLSAPGTFPGIHFFGDHVVGDVAAPIFLFLVGLSRSLSLGTRIPAGADDRAEMVRTMKRGALIFLIGVVTAFLVREPLVGDVLPLIGFSLVVLALLRHRSVPALVALAVVIVMISPSLRAASAYQDAWGGFADVPTTGELFPGFMVQADHNWPKSAGTATDTLLLFLCNGYFPVFPWLAFPLLGLAVGKVEFTGDAGRLSRLALVTIGLVVCAAGVMLAVTRLAPDGNVVTDLVAPLAFYPETASMLFVQLGLVLVLFAWLRSRLDRPGGSQSSQPAAGWLTACSRLSRYALSFYVLHQMLIFWPIWVAGALDGELKKYEANAATPPVALALSVAMLALLQGVAKAWDRVGGRLSLDWLLGSMTDPSQFGRFRPTRIFR